MKKSKQIIFSVTLLVFVFFIIFLLPPLKAFLNKELNKDFIEKIENEALSANIKIVQIESTHGENSVSTSYSVGASGVIIAKEGNRYYALTAKHVISEGDTNEEIHFAVMGYDDLDFVDHLDNGGKYVGLENYFEQFSRAVVEYSSEQYDLALISFVSNNSYLVLPIADVMPSYGDKVGSMSNPYSERNIITVGKISSRKSKHFRDEAGKTQYEVVEHNARTSAGSSGSALLNEDLEIVGINLGGNENIFRQFVSGLMMASNRIHEFLKESGHEF